MLTVAAQCAKDKLTIADNTASRYTCGSSSLASTATYRDGDVSFHFTTDGSGTGSGFIATYKLIDKAVASKKSMQAVLLGTLFARQGDRVKGVKGVPKSASLWHLN